MNASQRKMIFTKEEIRIVFEMLKYCIYSNKRRPRALE